MANKTPLAFHSPDLFKRVDTQTTTQDYRNKQSIFAQGDKADAMFYIRNGSVKLTVASKTGKKAIVAILKAGEFFGEGCLARQSMRVFTATAIQSSAIARIKRSDLVRILHQEPSFAKLFVAYLLFRISRIEEEFVDQIFSSSEKRLARALLLLSGFGSQSKTATALQKVNQETLAEMVGTTRSRVSYFMNRFRERGFINYNGSLQVHKALLDFLLSK
jgi:CRP/FNR family transcriptional regulator, cyclic AMP receptor protein